MKLVQPSQISTLFHFDSGNRSDHFKHLSYDSCSQKCNYEPIGCVYSCAEIIQVPKPSMIGSLYICDRCIESHRCLDPCIYVLQLQYGIENVTSKILEWSVKTTGLQPAINATIQHLARSAYLPRQPSDMLFDGN